MRKVCVGAWVLAWLIVLAVSLVGCFDDTPRMLPPELEPSGNETAVRASQIIVPTRPYVMAHFVEPSFRDTPLTADDYDYWEFYLNTILRDTQTFFADQMEEQGYGRQTFEILSHADSSAVIGWHQLPESAEVYAADEIRMLTDIAELDVGGTPYRTYRVYVLDLPTVDWCGRGSANYASGSALVFGSCWQVDTLAHELGHAFGLRHDWRSASFVMSYGERLNPQDTTPQHRIRSEFSAGAVGWLAQMPAFTGRIPVQERYGEIGGFTVTHMTPLARPGRWFDIGLSFNVWTSDLFPYRPVSDAVTRQGYAHGVLLDASERLKIGHVLAYFSRDDMHGEFWAAGTGVTARTIAENLPQPRHAYMEYTVQFQAEVPVDLRKVEMRLVTEDGFIAYTTLRNWSEIYLPSGD